MTENRTSASAPIVVGLDGSESSAHALDWAAAEAVLRHVPLVIAHAGDLPHREALSEATARDAMAQIGSYGQQLLTDAIATAVEQHDDIEVTTVLREQDPTSLLVELSGDAQLIVVGRAGGNPFARALLGTTSHRLAAHAACPVAIIDAAPAGSDHIVVGVSPTPGGQHALRFAAAEAARRGVTLHLVRSWTEAALTSAAVSMGYVNPYPAIVKGEGKILDEAVALVAAEFPSVTVTKELTAVGAYQSLPDAAEKAALLVVGRRRDEGALPHLGSLASWLAQHAPCPLVIVPASE